jgi:hypothetical protein
MTFQCGNHRAYIYAQGGAHRIAELTPLTHVEWKRIRDDVSTGVATVPTNECCELVSTLRTVKHELHIYRNGQPVWQGPITRLEYEFDQVQIFAEDVLWQTKRSVIEQGYNNADPNIGWVIDRMEWLLYHSYSKMGDPWRMTTGRIHPIRGSDDPKTSRVVFAWQMYVWDDLDKYAEDYGTDYVVVNRDIYFFDTGLKWLTLPALDESDLSQSPRVVEYGNQLATRGIVTNGRGYAGISPVNDAGLAEYGLIDWLITNEIDGTAGAVVGSVPAPTPPSGASGGTEPTTPPVAGPPTAREIEQWTGTATRNIRERTPAPVAVVIPANSTLMPHAPWNVNMLIPGAWFQISTAGLCREVTEWQRIQEVTVTEGAPQGETIKFTAATAPANPVEYFGGPISFEYPLYDTP